MFCFIEKWRWLLMTWKPSRKMSVRFYSNTITRASHFTRFKRLKVGKQEESSSVHQVLFIFRWFLVLFGVYFICAFILPYVSWFFALAYILLGNLNFPSTSCKNQSQHTLLDYDCSIEGKTKDLSQKPEFILHAIYFVCD